MKVYILTSYFGEYDDSWDKIEGAYSDPVKAEERKEYLTSDYKARWIELQKDPPEDDGLYDEWWNSFISCQDYKFTRVTEHELIN